MKGAKVNERFWSKVDKSGDCWEWRGEVSTVGYGRFWVNNHKVQAHRFAYYGESEAGMPFLDHLCRNRPCVRPEHLEPVTNRENLLRSPLTLPSIAMAKTNCVNGHPFTPENTIVWPGGTHRRCRTCTLRVNREKYRRHAEGRRAYARERYWRLKERANA